MEDLISRQVVFDLMRSLTRWCVKSEDGKFNNVGLLYDDVMFGIDKLPSVKPQAPKTGHWIEKDDNLYVCSECGQYIYSETEHDLLEFHAFCGRCGAKMIEPQESEEV